MRNILVMMITVALTTSCLAEVQKRLQGPQGPRLKLSKEKIAYLQMKNFGGYVNDTRNQRGSIVVVNAQSAADPAWFDAVTESLARTVRVRFEVRQGKFEFPNPSVPKETACVFVVDDPKMPASLLAAEAGWAMCNVSPLRAGAGNKPPFFKARVEKQLMRSLAYLMGSADSQYPMSICRCMTKPEDLDQHVDYRLPVDILGKMAKYVAGYGVTPYVRKSYKMAVTEGWAAQPTNEFQKAIWDEIHTLPTKPIEIKPEK